MPLSSLPVCDWLIAGFHLGRARDAFDPDIALRGDEDLRPGLLRRLASVLYAHCEARPTHSSAFLEIEELEALWYELTRPCSTPVFSVDVQDSRVIRIHEGLLRTESWIRSCDDVLEPGSSMRLAFELGIELGRSFAVWPSADDPARPLTVVTFENQPENWYGWGYRNSNRVLERSRPFCEKR